MSVRDYGELPLLLTSLVIYPYTYLTDTIGAAVTMPEQMKFELEFETDQAEVKSGGKRVHAATVVTGGKFNMSAAGLSWDALTTLTGWTRNSPSAGVQTLQGTPGQPLPWFAVAGKMLDAHTGDVHVGIVACTLDAPPKWTVGENAEFMVSEMAGKVIMIDGRQFPYIRPQQTASAINATLLFS